jgi:hypothetical protein
MEKYKIIQNNKRTNDPQEREINTNMGYKFSTAER